MITTALWFIFWLIIGGLVLGALWAAVRFFCRMAGVAIAPEIQTIIGCLLGVFIIFAIINHLHVGGVNWW